MRDGYKRINQVHLVQKKWAAFGVRLQVGLQICIYYLKVRFYLDADDPTWILAGK
jgi:hypothetical protein